MTITLTGKTSVLAASLVTAASAVLAVAGCGPASGKTAAAASRLAAAPSLSAAASQAAAAGTRAVRNCLHAAGTGTEPGMLACLKTQLPPAIWQHAVTCLGHSYLDDAGYTHAGYQAWTARGIQPCITAAEQATAAQEGK